MTREDPRILDLFDGLEDEASPVAPSPSGERSPDTSTEDGVGSESPTPGGSLEPEVWTVSQVNRAVRNLLEGALPALWVAGEVGGWKRARSGHCYFTLKDDRAQLRCVLFRTDAARLPTDPEEGMELRVHGRLTLYEARGEYQLVARTVEAGDAEGLWRLAFEKLRAKLEAEGVLTPERKRPLPRFPSCVGVVTSPTGAALRDILTVLARRAPWTRVVLRGCRVQGEGAAGEIAAALRALYRSGLADVVIVGRGGGSIEDLWAFNEEPVARAVAEAPVPVISAVGHEVDVTIADLVADARAPTPSAAAETAVQDGATLLELLRDLPPRLSRALIGGLEARRQALQELRGRLGGAVETAVGRRRERATTLLDRAERAIEGVVEGRRQRLARATAKLEALSPLSTLRRGYAVPLDEGGRVLREVQDFEVGRRFDLRVSDGRVGCETVDVRPERPTAAEEERHGA